MKNTKQIKNKQYVATRNVEFGKKGGAQVRQVCPTRI